MGVQPGFTQLKVLRQAQNAVCFAEFVDIDHASQCHARLQGHILSSSDRGGIRVQYSKNPFGQKRNRTGAAGQAAYAPQPAVAADQRAMGMAQAGKGAVTSKILPTNFRPCGISIG